MNRPKRISENLIAPCGMNCAICSRYLAYINNLKRSKCIGCQARNTTCTYLFKDCVGPKKNSTNSPAFCFECEKYPCKQIDRMDKRYILGYGISIKENLDYIRKNGITKFTKEQYRKYHCPQCFGMISVHNRKCFKCDPITRLVEKLNADVKRDIKEAHTQEKEAGARKLRLTKVSTPRTHSLGLRTSQRVKRS